MPLPTIPSGNVASALPTGYDVANSCRFDASSSAYMHKTPSSTGVEEKFTFSFWIKYNHNHSSNQCVLFIEGSNGANDYVEIAFKPHLDIQFNNGTYARYETNRKFRDPSAWYHIVIAVDTTQSTAGNRLKLYVNGTQETSWATETVITQNDVLQANTSGKKMWLNAHYNGPKNFIDGYLAEVVWIDGTQYAAQDFGEFDSDTPNVWKPKDVSGLTFGTNGFYLDFEDSSNLGNDANGGTDLTEVNLAATDQSISTPTNNFANYFVDMYSPDVTFSEGGLKVAEASNNWRSAYGNIGVTSGKWYAEFRVNYTSGNEAYFGVADEDHLHGIATFTSGSSTGASGGTYDFIGNSSGSMGYYTGGNYYSRITGSQVNATYAGTAQSNNDIIGIALDMDNNKVYFSKNGVWADGSGSWGSSTFNSSTGALSITSKTTFFAVSPNESVIEANFGDPSFSISSGNADANGYGNMEYAFPNSSYYSLCTKNLAEFG